MISDIVAWFAEMWNEFLAWGTCIRDWFLSVFVAAAEAIYNWLWDIVYGVILIVADLFISTLGMVELDYPTLADLLSELPAGMVGMLGRLGIGEAMGIIAGALSTRVVLVVVRPGWWLGMR